MTDKSIELNIETKESQKYYNSHVFEYIKSDCYRYTGKSNAVTVMLYAIRYAFFRYQCIIRLRHCTGFKRIIANILYIPNQTRKHNSIRPETKIGYGFFVEHGGPIFINGTAEIGNNCSFSQCNTIGSNNDNAAIIGDNVYLGPNVCVVEKVKIGNNVTIGAGSIVTKDIPDNATAAGNYAKVLNYNKPGRFIRNPWPIDNK